MCKSVDVTLFFPPNKSINQNSKVLWEPMTINFPGWSTNGRHDRAALFEEEYFMHSNLSRSDVNYGILNTGSG